MQPGEERRVLEGLLDERVHVLFERQVHPDADALRPLVCLRRPRPFVGGLHQTRAATRNDVAIHSTQRRAHLLDFLVNPVARLGARGSEHRHAIAVVPRWTQAAQVVDRRPKPEERVDEDASDGFLSYRRILVTEGIRRQRFELAI